MYGVVLWSDHDEKKAVIWCEDQGDLAFYGGNSASVFDGCTLDAGDLVHFQVQEGYAMRLAHNPELVAERHAPELAERLKAAINPAKAVQEKTAPQIKAQSNVLQFPAFCSA